MHDEADIALRLSCIRFSSVAAGPATAPMVSITAGAGGPLWGSEVSLSGTGAENFSSQSSVAA